MTNLGFRLGMQRLGINVVDTAVGDRFVLEALDAGGFALGGEQSGHLIFRDRATTGDGLLSAAVTAEIGSILATTASTAAAARDDERSRASHDTGQTAAATAPRA